MSEKKNQGWVSLIGLFVVASAVMASFSIFRSDSSFGESFIFALVNLPLLVVSVLGGALILSWITRNHLDDAIAGIIGGFLGGFLLYPLLSKIATSVIGFDIPLVG